MGYSNTLSSSENIETVQTLNPSKDIETVRKQYESQLMSISGVIGVGIGECEKQVCLKIWVKERTPELEKQIPTQLEGFKVDIEVSGPIESQ